MDIPKLGDGPTNSGNIGDAGIVETPRLSQRERYSEVAWQRRCEASKRYRIKNRAVLVLRAKAWVEKNRERVRIGDRRRHGVNKVKRNQESRDYQDRNRDAINAQRKIYRQNNREKLIAASKAFHVKNPNYSREQAKRYQPRRMELKKRKYHTDPVERAKCLCRTRVAFILKKAGVPKFDRTFDLVGCTPDFLTSFLESQFTDGMTWGNHGTYWEIDHVIPLCRFDIVDPEQRRRAFNYSNCKPLLKPDNRSKNAKMPEPHQALLI